MRTRMTSTVYIKRTLTVTDRLSINSNKSREMYREMNPVYFIKADSNYGESGITSSY